MTKENRKPNKTSQPFKARIVLKDGKRKLQLNSPTYFQGIIERLPLNSELTLWFDERKLKRSEAQNRFYWLYLNLIEQETGNSADDMHLLFRGLFLSKGITEVFGHKVRQVKSTTDLNKSEFTEYLLKIEEKTDVPLPDTSEFNPQHYDNW